MYCRAPAGFPCRCSLRFPQEGERRRQLPIAHYRSVVQGGWLAAQDHQVMQRVEDLFVVAVSAAMPRHHGVAIDHLHAIHVALDRHHTKSASPRHAVVVAVELDRLVLVHTGWLLDARVKAMRR